MYPSAAFQIRHGRLGASSNAAARRAGTGTGSREDPKVGFHADDAAGDPGRALRAMYYQRKSKTKRRSSPTRRPTPCRRPRERWTLERVAAILAPLFASGSSSRSSSLPRRNVPPGDPVACGHHAPPLGRPPRVRPPPLGEPLEHGDPQQPGRRRRPRDLVFSGAFGVAALVSGCPTLSAPTPGEPSSFEKAYDPSGPDNGASVFFFYGSAACPYCSASSWAMVVALEAFGTLSGTYLDRSNPSDVYPNTPELVLASATLQSK